MSRRAKIRWISYLCAFALCMCGVLASGFAGAARYERRINAETSRALGNAMDAVDSLDRSLRKSAVAATPVMENAICTEISSNAQQAETALSVLPVRSDSLEKIAKHISLAGDYAAMLSRANAGGKPFDDAAMQQLARFSDTTAHLHDALASLQEKLTSGDISNEVFKRITDTFDNLEPVVSEDAHTLETEMESIAEAFPDVPAITYDGKYTDHDGDTPKVLENQPDITQKEARQIAADWLGADAGALEDSGESSGRISGWCFSARDDNGARTIMVSKAGGVVLWSSSDPRSGEASLSTEEAKQKAAEFLQEHGISDMECIRAAISGGEAVLRFAPVLDAEVLCYPDEISVTVSLTDGSVTGYNAEKYVQHHTQRDLTVFQTDEAAWKTGIPTSLHVVSVRPVILSGRAGQDLMCYAIDCADDAGASYRIFVNAESGEQEMIQLPDELEEIG